MAEEAKEAEKIPEPKEIIKGGGRKVSDRVGITIFTILGALVGYASYVINWPPYALVLAVVVIVVAYLVMKKGLKIIEDKKWWTGKVATYIFMWIIVWTIFFNVFIVKAL